MNIILYIQINSLEASCIAGGKKKKEKKGKCAVNDSAQPN